MGELMRLVEIPAQFKTITKTVLGSSARSKTELQQLNIKQFQ